MCSLPSRFFSMLDETLVENVASGERWLPLFSEQLGAERGQRAELGAPSLEYDQNTIRLQR
jgi:hypothetical protein